MHFSIPLLIISLLYLLLITFLFVSKKKENNIETKIYSVLLITTMSGIILDILGIYAHMNLSDTNLIRWFIVKLYLIYLLTTAFLISAYISILPKKNAVSNDTFKSLFSLKKIKILLFSYCISGLLVFILPFEYFKNGNIIYVYGLSCFFLYGVVFFNVFYWLSIILIHRKNISKRKIMPILTFIIFCIPVVLIQFQHPEMLLVTTLATFVVIFMYHTIENPDVKMIEQLNTAKTAAEKANKAKTDFLSSMSHEIRTPLNAIVGFSECILKEENLDSAKNDAKDIIMASQNLLEIVNGVLDISKIEADKMEIIESEYNLRDNLDSLSKLMLPRIGEKPIEFKTKFAPDIPSTLYGDVAKIKQIITNILTNAVKYTERGIITFEVNCINKENICSLVISVEDTGRGIPSDKINTIFNKFERLEEDRNTTLEGTGLGLAITKRLVEMMGGKIVVQSKYGAGSKFTVYLKQEIRNTVLKSEKSYAVTISNADFSNKRVLVIDDNRINLKVATRMLEPFKIQVDSCESGEECLNKISQGLKYDLIFMDDMMPKITGTETLHELKKDSSFSIPVVVLTANAIEGMREKYLQEGFSDYLAKPIDKLELERVLGQYLIQRNEKEEDIFEPLPEEIFDMNVPLKEDE